MVLVLLHGRWYEPDSMHALTRQVDLPGVECIAPAAPERTWYPKRYFDPRPVNEPQLSEAIATVHRTLDRVAEDGVSPDEIVVGGFSQGGCVVLQALVEHPRPVAAVVSFCGGLIGPDDDLVEPPPGALEGLRVLLTATEEDEWVPVERIERTREILSAAGAQVDMPIHPPAEHAVHAAEVDAFRDLLMALGEGR